MKHSREVEVMVEAFRRSGIPVSGAMVNAMADGLKLIRKERYEERKISRRQPGRAEGGRRDGEPRIITAGGVVDRYGENHRVTTADGTPV